MTPKKPDAPSAGRRLPLHPLMLAAYPALALMAANLGQAVLSAAVRPLLLSLLLAVVFYALALLLVRSGRKAALLTSLFILLFFSYGHLYQYLREPTVLGETLVKHSTLGALYLLLLLGGGYLILRSRGTLENITRIATLISAVLLLAAVAQIGLYTVRFAALATRHEATSDNLKLDNLNQAPDIYYIVLDSYSRADMLADKFGFDNQPFLNELKQMGFYVVECGRSNYEFTEYSMAATLNMEFIQKYGSDFREKGKDFPLLETLIKEGKVRKQFESLGYRTVGFATGFPWGEWEDASVYLQPTDNNALVQKFSPFEAMFIRSSLLRFFTDLHFLRGYVNVDAVNFPYSEVVKRERFAFDQLDNIASLAGPKFVYAHLMTSHDPIIFDQDGNILTDPGFFPADNLTLTPGYFKKGAVMEFEYTNKRILPIVRRILSQSRVPPIIILQGDHGRMNPKQPILNAIYLPGAGSQALYPTLTPVNTFRIIFNTYFGGHYELQPDTSYHIDPDVPGVFSEVGDPYPACQR